MAEQEYENQDNMDSDAEPLTIAAGESEAALEETVVDAQAGEEASAPQQVEAEVKAEMDFDPEVLKPILEALLISADRPLSIKRIQEILSDGDSEVAAASLRSVLDEIAAEFADRSMELVEVSSGYRFQVKQKYAQWVQRLWEEKPQRYSRALLETLAIIAYRQPITRGEIEEIRGVSVSSSILKTLQEREWCRVVGHRDVPGKPAMFATTRGFLDYFGLTTLDDLPTLAELRDIDSINAEFDFEEPKAANESADADAEGEGEEDTLAHAADAEYEDNLFESDEDIVDENNQQEQSLAEDMADVEEDTVDEESDMHAPAPEEDEDEDNKSLSSIVDGLEERLRRYDDGQDRDDSDDLP